MVQTGRPNFQLSFWVPHRPTYSKSFLVSFTLIYSVVVSLSYTTHQNLWINRASIKAIGVQAQQHWLHVYMKMIVIHVWIDVPLLSWHCWHWTAIFHVWIYQWLLVFAMIKIMVFYGRQCYILLFDIPLFNFTAWEVEMKSRLLIE